MKRLALLTLLVALLTPMTVEAENYILYKSTDGNIVNPSRYDSFGAQMVSNTYERGQGKMVFEGNVTVIGEEAFKAQNRLYSIEIPSTVTKIGNFAFTFCDNLTSVTLPSSIKEMGDGVFSWDTSLKSVEMPNSITTITRELFSYCFGLESVVIPSSITKIDDYAFYACRSLPSIEIPSSVTEIGQSVFYQCKSLTSVVIPSSVTKMGGCVFEDCTNLEWVEIPNSVTEVGNGLFKDCFNLSKPVYNDKIFCGLPNNYVEYTVPDGIETIAGYAFYNHSFLRSIHIPASVTEIGECAFAYDYDMDDIYIDAPTPPNVGESCFRGITPTCVLNVPTNARETYKTTGKWSSFWMINPYDTSEKGTISNPYTAAEAIEFASSLAADKWSSPVFVRGIVSRTKEVSPKYGNATFYISDDGTRDNEFYIYRCQGLRNRDIETDDEVKVGDDVTILAFLTNYKGCTPETVSGYAYIYFVNTLTGDINGDGMINTADVVAVYNIILGTTTGVGDINNDGVTNTADVVSLYNIILKGEN